MNYPGWLTLFVYYSGGLTLLVNYPGGLTLVNYQEVTLVCELFRRGN